MTNRIPKSKLDAFDVRKEVSLRKLAQSAFDSVSLDSLTDVVSLNPDDGDILQYNDSLMVWENVPLPPASVGNLDDIGDVNIVSVSNGQLLGYNSTSQQWENVSINIPVNINDLDDVAITAVADNDVLTYDSGTGRWVNAPAAGGGATELDDLTDVDIISATDGDLLEYDGASSRWLNIPRSKILVAAGSANQIQYKGSAGGFAANANFNFNPSTQTLVVDNIVSNQYRNIDTASTVFGTGNANPVLVSCYFLGNVGALDLTSNNTAGTAVNELRLRSNGAAPLFWNGTTQTTVLHSGNVGSFAATSVNTRQGAVTLTDTDVPATAEEWSTTSRTAALTDRGLYLYATATGAKTFEFTTATGGSPGEYHLRNDAASGNITVTTDRVVVKPPKGGTLILEPGDTVTIKQVTTNVFHMFGSTQAA